MAPESNHVSVWVSRPAAEVYDYVRDPVNLPSWAHGLGTSVEHVDGQWVAESPMGRVVFTFVPHNEHGVLDHDVTVPSGETFHNPMRVIPDGARCEVVFTVRRRSDMSADDFERDAEAVCADLARLKELLEAR